MRRLLILLVLLVLGCTPLLPSESSPIDVRMTSFSGFSETKAFGLERVLFMSPDEKGRIALIFSSPEDVRVELEMKGLSGLNCSFYPPSFRLRRGVKKACLLRLEALSFPVLYLSPLLSVKAGGKEVGYPLPPILVAGKKPSLIIFETPGDILSLERGEEAEILLISDKDEELSIPEPPLGIYATISPSSVEVKPEGRAWRILIRAEEDAIPWLYEVDIKGKKKRAIVVEVK